MKEQDTFNRLVVQHRGLLFSVCHRYGRRGLDEDDLLQEVLVALWQRRDKLFSITIGPRQTAWMWRVARSTCVDLLRRTPPSYPPPDNYDPEDNTAPPAHNELHELIALLPEPDRSIVRLHLEGYGYSEIAKQTGLTKSNVGVRLSRAKERLRKELDN